MMLLLRQSEENNFDHIRFSASPEKEHSFDVNYHRSHLYFLLNNFQYVSAVHDIFKDEASRSLYRDIIEYRLVGHLHKRLPTNTPKYHAATSRAQNLESAPSIFNSRVQRSALSLPLETVSVPFQGRTLQVDCWKLGCRDTFFLGQYNFERDGVRIAPEPGNYFIDGGTFYGDTAVRMAAQVGVSGYVYCFDPMDFHCEIADHNLRANAAGSAPSKILRCGIADVDNVGTAFAESSLTPGYRLKPGIATRSIDSLMKQGEIERIDFIKLDVEGSEMAALRGAAQSLARFRPKLAISLYHNPQDIFEIPLHLHKTLPGYEFYLDHYSIHAEETVLYARPIA